MKSPAHADDAFLVETRQITKRYGTFIANDHIDFSVKKGEIHALLGENGAGKSTLVKLLYGALQPDEGVICWRGEPVEISSPSAARSMGIGMVFQHFSLFESLTVAENIALALEDDLSLAEISKKAQETSKRYGLPLNPDQLVADLSVGERQRLEIIRCLMQDPDLLMLDEPTSVLTPQEAEKLFETLDTLKREGRSVLFITHRLEEVRALCDRATILRFGKVSGECDPSTTSAGEIARMMVGNEVNSIERAKAKIGQPLLQVESLSFERNTPFGVSLKSIDLDVHGGEIVAIAGVAGNGQSELFDAISGEQFKVPSDSLRIRGHKAGHLDINGRRMLGAAFVPEERMGHGAVSELKLSENLLLSRHASDQIGLLWGGTLRLIWNAMVKRASTRVADGMDVRRPNENPTAGSLSGGNLQKFVVGRELDRSPSVLVVNQPSWGVDAGAAARIRQELRDLAQQDSAVLIISQDLDEIFQIADRVAVLYDGNLSKACPLHTLTREEIGLLMAGSGLEHASRAA